MDSASDWFGVATGPIALLDAGSRLLSDIHHVLQFPEQVARLAERAEVLWKMHEDVQVVPDDAVHRFIREELESILRDVESLSKNRGPFTRILRSAELGRLQEIECRLQVLKRNVAPIDDKVRCLNQAVETPLCNVGLDRCEQALKFLKESQESKQSLRVIGIHGQAGVGKTTLLNAIWKQAASKTPFRAQAYVQVGENATSETITKLQSSIYRQLSTRHVEFPTHDFGKGELSQLFRKLKEEGKPIFIGIDNVFKEQHLMDLLPSDLRSNDIPLASCIAVTCRDHKIVKAMLRICQLGAANFSQVCVFEPKCLTLEDSKRVFAESAGVQHSDPALQDLLDAMVPLCGGLPLALKILGSIFADEEKRKPYEWHAIKSQWATFRDQDDAYTAQVTGVLDLSYKNLKESRKEAFLDVAIWFYGWPWVVVESIVGKEILRDLRESSLVWQVHDIGQCNQSEISDQWLDNDGYYYNEDQIYETFVSMHDLTLRFAKSHPAEPEECFESHLTSLEDLPKQISLKNLTLRIGDEHYNQQLFSYIQETSGLQTLTVRRTDGPSMIKYRLTAFGGRQQKLRFLDLQGTWPRRNEISFLMKKEALQDIVYLRLAQCGIEWPRETSSPCLQILSITDCSGPLFDVGKLRSLKMLYMSSCEGLIELAESMGSMESLVCLYVRQYGSLVELPDDIGKLCSLKELGLHSSLQKLPESMCGMEYLERLDLSWCRNLVELPDDIGKLCSLKELCLLNCDSLQKLPESICGMEYLEILDLSGCTNLVDLPGDIGKLRCLKDLRMLHRGSLQRLPESMCGMEYLERLDMSDCRKLVDLPGDFGKLRCLKELCLSGCESLQTLPDSMCGMEYLEMLSLSFCKNLVDLPGDIGKLRCLKELHLMYCESLHKLPESMCGMEYLERLDLSSCKNLVELPGDIGELRCLNELDLTGCDSLMELPALLGNMRSLRKLALSNCKVLEKYEGSMEYVESLKVEGCSNGGELSVGVVEKLPSLKTLCLERCDSVTEMLADEVASRMESLEVLKIEWCENLRELPAGVGKLRSLKTLSLSGCEILEKLPESVGSMESLETLKLQYCRTLEELPEQLESLTSLRTLAILYCPNLRKLPALSSSVTIQRELREM